jgi:hypothetical protein
MTKKELIEALSDYKDDDVVVITIHDTVAYEDNYDFYVDGVYLDALHNNHESEIQLTLINHNVLNPQIFSL